MPEGPALEAPGLMLAWSQDKANRPTHRPITSSNPRSVGCHSPQAVHHGLSTRHKSWRAVASLRGRPTYERNAAQAAPDSAPHGSASRM